MTHLNMPPLLMEKFRYYAAAHAARRTLLFRQNHGVLDLDDMFEDTFTGLWKVDSRQAAWLIADLIAEIRRGRDGVDGYPQLTLGELLDELPLRGLTDDAGTSARVVLEREIRPLI